MSNTEKMVSVPRDLMERIEASLDRHMAGHAPMRIPVDQTDSDLVREEVRMVLAKPVEQHQGDPVAWMFKVRVHVTGLGLVWREKIEHYAPDTEMVELRDLVPLYTHQAPADPGEVDRLRAELAQCEAMAAMVAECEWSEHVGTGPVSSKVEAAFTQLHNELHDTGEKLDSHESLFYALDCAWNSHDGKEAFSKLMREVEAISSGADHSVEANKKVERDERADFERVHVELFGCAPRTDDSQPDFALTHANRWKLWQARAAMEGKQ